MRRPTPSASRNDGKCDRVERPQRCDAAFVELRGDGEPVADAAQPAALLQEGRELLVAHLHRLLLCELLFELRGRIRVFAKGGGRSRQECLGVAALELQEIEHVRCPGLVRQQLGERDARVERIRARSIARVALVPPCGASRATALEK